MLDLNNVLWVIPGVIFIYFYNRRRPTSKTPAITLSGWPYLFLLVIIASLTWFPAEWITKDVFSVDEILSQKLITLLISVVFLFILLLLAQWELIANLIFLPVQDNFYKKCVEWENDAILLTLKNGKSYIGILWKYPENPKSRHESQTISIIPFKSGCRVEETKKIEWNTDYPEYKNKSQFVNMEIIIPRSEIVTFGKFSERTFRYFYNGNDLPKEVT